MNELDAFAVNTLEFASNLLQSKQIKKREKGNVRKFCT